MTTLQNDLLDIYNQLTVFSKETLEDPKRKKPIVVQYDEDNYQIVFSQGGISVRINHLLYYVLGLEDLKKPTYLLPNDYDYLMATLLTLTNSGELIKDRTCLSPENYGFDIYAINLKSYGKGPNIIGQVRIVSGVSWFFKLRTKLKYKNVL